MIACHNALRHRFSVLPPELPDDPANPAHIPCRGLDWAAVVIRTKKAHFTIVSVSLPGEHDEHVIAFQQYVDPSSTPICHITWRVISMHPQKKRRAEVSSVGSKDAF